MIANIFLLKNEYIDYLFHETEIEKVIIPIYKEDMPLFIQLDIDNRILIVKDYVIGTKDVDSLFLLLDDIYFIIEEKVKPKLRII